MAAQILISVPYALARLAVWLLLLAVAVIDGLKHRHIRSRGYQLYLALTIVCALFTLKNIVYLAISLEAGSEDGAATAAYIVYIFFSDLAEGLWIGVLLAISAGYWYASHLTQTLINYISSHHSTPYHHAASPEKTLDLTKQSFYSSQPYSSPPP